MLQAKSSLIKYDQIEIFRTLRVRYISISFNVNININ